MKTPDEIAADLKQIRTKSASTPTNVPDGESILDTVAIAPVPTLLTSDTGVLLGANQAFCDLLGYSEKELLSGGVTFMHPDDLDEETKLQDQVKLGVIDNFSMERRYLTISGEEVCTILTGSLVQNLEEARAYFIKQVVDISHLRQRELKLRRNQQLLIAAINAPDDMIYAKDLEGRYLMVNTAAANFLGKSVHEIIGKTDADFFPADLARSLDQEDKEVLATGRSHSYEYLSEREGEKGTRFAIKSVYKSSKGKSLGIVGISRDITARKQAEEILRESEERLQSAQRIAKLGFWDWDLVHDKIYWSDELYSILDIKPGEIETTYSALIEKIHPEDRQSFKALCDAALQGESSFKHEHRFVRPGGDIRHHYVEGKVIRDEQGQALRMLTTVLDVTDQKRSAEALAKSEERLRRYFDAEIVGMTVISVASGLIDCNKTYCEITGYSFEELKGKSWQELTYPDDIKETREAVKRMLSGESDGYSLEKRYLRKDGSVIHVTASAKCIRNEAGEVEFLVGFVQDMTAQRQAQRALVESENRFRSAFDHAAMAMSIIDDGGKFLKVNRAMCHYLGYSQEQLLNMNWRTITYPEDIKNTALCLQRLSDGEIATCSHEMRLIHKSGVTKWGLSNFAPMYNAEGKISSFITQIQDITEARQLSEQVSYQATHDQLTGLVNRLEFERRLGRVLKTAKDTKTEHTLAYLDVGQFKSINDTCGHMAGDELLRQLAKLLNSKVRKRDTLGRLGGDEFGILMEDCQLRNASRVISALRDAVQQFQFEWEGKHFNVGVSIGLVPINESSENITEILKQADAARFVAKEEGANRIYIHNSEDPGLTKRRGEMQWAAQIDEALAAGRLQVAFQPIMAVASSDEHGKKYEVLLRLLNEDGEIIGPRSFLPAAERYGLATRLDKWVVQRVVEIYEQYPEFSANISNLSINISKQTLLDDAYLSFLGVLFEDGRLPAEKLSFEIAESAAVSHLSKAIQFIKALKIWGCDFALDDVGSGLSSLAYLRPLPVSTLKIDGSCVKDIVADPVAYAMIKSINEISHLMGKQTIAEHVENEAILTKIKEIGVDYAQGSQLGKPLLIEQILQTAE